MGGFRLVVIIYVIYKQQNKSCIQLQVLRSTTQLLNYTFLEGNYVLIILHLFVDTSIKQTEKKYLQTSLYDEGASIFYDVIFVYMMWLNFDLVL